MNQHLKKYIICLFFSIDLFVLVLLSEILRNVVLAMSTGLNSGIFPLIVFSIEIFVAFVIVIVPSLLLIMWIINPIAIKKLLVQFGLNEKLLDRKSKKENNNKESDNYSPTHDQIRYAILTILYKKAEKTPNDSNMSRESIIDVLKVPKNTVDFNIKYLAEEKLIAYSLSLDNKLEECITSLGINVIEHKEENKSLFPFLNATIPIQIQTKIGIINL